MEQLSTVKRSIFFPTGEYFNRYLRLPFKMLTNALDKKSSDLTEVEAFIQLIANVRYADKEEPVGNKICICHRGESYKSLQAWSILMHWNKSKTRRYFLKLKNDGIIEMDHDNRTSRIRVIHYDYYVGKSYSAESNTYTPDFETFWKTYHDTTLIPATDKIAAFKLWQKISATEREKAKAKISRYYYSLSKTTYCVKALTYLKNKKFNDQFNF